MFTLTFTHLTLRLSLFRCVYRTGNGINSEGHDRFFSILYAHLYRAILLHQWAAGRGSVGVSRQVKGIPEAAEGIDGIEHHCAQLVCHHQRDHAHKVRDLDLKGKHTIALSSMFESMLASLWSTGHECSSEHFRSVHALRDGLF